MLSDRRPGLARAAFVLLLGLCVVIAAALVVLGALNHEHFGSERLRHAGLPLVALLLAASALALWAWWRELVASGAGGERGRRQLGRLRELPRTEQRWVRHLREQVHDSHRRAGALGADDVRSLVLRIAMELLEA